MSLPLEQRVTALTEATSSLKSHLLDKVLVGSSTPDDLTVLMSRAE
jgi:hypothetical protein